MLFFKGSVLHVGVVITLLSSVRQVSEVSLVQLQLFGVTVLVYVLHQRQLICVAINVVVYEL